MATAGFAGRAGSTAVVGSATAALVGGLSIWATPPAAAAAGATAGTIASGLWVGSGAADFAGRLAEDAALYAMGCE